MVVRAAAAAETVIMHGGCLLQAAQKLQPEFVTGTEPEFLKSKTTNTKRSGRNKYCK